VAEEVRAEMVANVLKVVVSVGERVEAGTMVALLESMKMEIPVLTESAGRISEIKIADGDVVRAGDLLVTLS
jgi:acetyl-CoA carboxylase biotin carboxyl carrier protein